MTPTGTTAAFVNGTLNNVSVNFSSAGSFTITATKTGGTPAGTSATFVVKPAAVSAAKSVATVPAGTVGVQTAVTLHTKDAFGNPRISACNCTTAATVTGPNANAAVSVNDNGNGTYSITYTPTAIGNDLIAITLDGVQISGSPYTSTVGVGALDHFLVEKAGGGSIGTITADTVSLQITAKDAGNNTITSFTASSDPVIMKLGTSVVGAATAFTSGVGTALTALTKAGSFTVTASQTISGKTGSAPAVINPGPAALLNFITQPTNGTAGIQIPAVTVAVQDKFGNTVTNDNSTSVHLGNLGSPLDIFFPSATAVNGIVTLTPPRFRGAMSLQLTATASPLVTAVSSSFSLSPAPLFYFDICCVASDATVFETVPVSVDIVARDSLGNQVPSFNHTVQVTAIGDSVTGPTTTVTLVNGSASAASISLMGISGFVRLQVTWSGPEGGMTNTFTVLPPIIADVRTSFSTDTYPDLARDPWTSSSPRTRRRRD
jgi:hypothetical protein